MKEFFAQYGLMLLWLAVAVVTLIVEALTTEMVSIWFTPGAVAAMILSIFIKEFWIQLLVFGVASILLLVLGKAYFKRHPFMKPADDFNADSLIGKTAVVLETVDNIRETGSVKIKSIEWTARSASDAIVIPAGTVVTVEEIAGVRLICKPYEQTETGAVNIPEKQA